MTPSEITAAGQAASSNAEFLHTLATQLEKDLLELLELAQRNGRTDLVQPLGDLLETNMLTQLEIVKGAH